MQIEFVPHAERKLRERGILHRIIEDVLSTPERVYQTHGRLVAYKKIGSRYLLVVHERKDQAVTVITAFWRDDPNW